MYFLGWFGMCMLRLGIRNATKIQMQFNFFQLDLCWDCPIIPFMQPYIHSSIHQIDSLFWVDHRQTRPCNRGLQSYTPNTLMPKTDLTEWKNIPCFLIITSQAYSLFSLRKINLQWRLSYSEQTIGSWNWLSGHRTVAVVITCNIQITRFGLFLPKNIWHKL